MALLTDWSPRKTESPGRTGGEGGRMKGESSGAAFADGCISETAIRAIQTLVRGASRMRYDALTSHILRRVRRPTLPREAKDTARGRGCGGCGRRRHTPAELIDGLLNNT